MGTSSSVSTKASLKVKEPKRYRVIMLNDDFTTMDFVVSILIKVFHKSELEAETIMLKVHHEGKAVVGVYSYDMALTRINKALDCAKEEGFPFRMTLEEA